MNKDYFTFEIRTVCHGAPTSKTTMHGEDNSKKNVCMLANYIKTPKEHIKKCDHLHQHIYFISNKEILYTQFLEKEKALDFLELSTGDNKRFVEYGGFYFIANTKKCNIGEAITESLEKGFVVLRKSSTTRFPNKLKSPEHRITNK